MDNPFKIVQLEKNVFVILENEQNCNELPFPFDTLAQARVALGRVRIMRVLKERKEKNLAFS